MTFALAATNFRSLCGNLRCELLILKSRRPGQGKIGIDTNKTDTVS